MRHDRIARDAGQSGIRKRRRDDRAVHHHENVFAGAFADVAVHIERDAFRVAVHFRFHADELRVHVVRGGLGHLRQRVGRRAVPGADADIDAAAQRFFAEIFSPLPAGQIDFDRTALRIDADVAIAAQNDRADVAGVEPC